MPSLAVQKLRKIDLVLKNCVIFLFESTGGKKETYYTHFFKFRILLWVPTRITLRALMPKNTFRCLFFAEL